MYGIKSTLAVIALNGLKHTAQVYSLLGSEGSSWPDTPPRESPQTGRPSLDEESLQHSGPPANHSHSCASPRHLDQ